MKKACKKVLAVLMAFMMLVPSLAILEGTDVSQSISALAASSTTSSAKVKVAKPKKFKVTAKKTKSLDVSFKKVSKADGYVIYYSTSKKFTKKTTKKITVKVTKKLAKKKTITKRISKLKTNKTYYVKVRAYRTVNKKKVYSKYTKVKKVKTLKKASATVATTAQTQETTTAQSEQTTAPASQTTQTTTTDENLPVSTIDIEQISGVSVVEGYIPDDPAEAEVTYSEDDETEYTRAEWVALLVEKLGISVTTDSAFGYSYSDIADTEYADIIETAYQYGMLPESANQDYDSDNDVPVFSPYETATREFAAYTIIHAMGYDLEQDLIPACADSESIIYSKEVAIAIQSDFLSTDNDNNFCPNNAMTGTDKNQIFAKIDNLKASEDISSDTIYQNVTYTSSAEGANTSNYSVTDNGNDTYTVVISKSAGNFSIGDVIVLPANDQYISGFPIKVTSVSISGDNYVLSATEPEIEEIYTGIEYQGYAIPVLDNITFADGVSASYDPNGTVNDDAEEFNLNAEATTNAGTIKTWNVDKKISDFVNIKGSITLSIPEIKARLSANIGWSGLSIDNLLISATESINAKTNITATTLNSSSEEAKEGSWELANIPFALGTTGLSINVIFHLNAQADGTFDVSYTVSLTNGFQYVNGSLRTITDCTNELDQLEAEASAKVGMTISFGLWALSTFDIISFDTDAGLGGKFSFIGHTDVEPNLYCGDGKLYIYMSLGLNEDCLIANVLDYFKTNYTFDIWDEDDSIWSKSLHFENGSIVSECSYGSGNFSGKIVDGAGNGISNASINIYKGNVKVTNVYSTNNGTFVTPNLPVGDYLFIISANGYSRYTSTESITSSSTVYLQPYVMTQISGNATGTVSGTIKNATTSSGIDDVTYTVYQNWNADDSSDVVTSGIASQSYSIELATGYYTIKFSADGYSSNIVNVTIENDENTTANVVLNVYDESLEGVFRIVLTWGSTPSDLDSHLYCVSESNPYHIYYSNKNAYSNSITVANLDVDDTTSYGPETVSIYEIDSSSSYGYYVQNYTNRSSTSSMVLSNSGATVKVYYGNNLRATFYVPSNTYGTVWHVFDYDPYTDTISPVNEMYYQSSVTTVNTPS